MTGEPSDRKPSTSSGELPPTQTVALKASRSRPDRRSCTALISHDGSGTRSGSAAAGGRARYGTRGSGANAGARPEAVLGRAAVGGGKVGEKPAGSAAQPRARPMTRLFGKGSNAYPGG